MKKHSLDSRRIGLFLLLAFGIAWAVGLWIYRTGGLINSPVLVANTPITLAYILLAFGYMFAPAVAAILTRVLTKEGWKDVGLRPKIKTGWPYWVAAWFGPSVLTLLGAYIYFAIYPAHYDSSLSALSETIAATGATLDIDLWTLVLIQLFSGVLLSPLLNGLFTLGEEFGWRAYLQPKLMPLGFRKAMLLSGVIWGLWHAPVIAMGHNYGFDYPGAPWSGILAMTFFTIVVGTVLGWLTLRGKSVWPAVIGHAAINGIASIGFIFINTQATPNPLLGPLPVGLIGGLPWLIVAAYLFWKGEPNA
jgi:membrane protease YdiL (CAAX protease family)